MTRNLRKEIYRTNPELKEKFPEKPDESETLDTEIEYSKKLMKIIKEELEKLNNEDKKIQNRINNIDELLESDKIKEIQSYSDKDAKQGYKSEAKNSEIKQAHGLWKSRYMGLSRVRIQSYITCIVANIKRTIKLMDLQEA